MTKRQRDAIIRVIEKDATIRGLYLGDSEGEACVIGGLALEANVPRETMEIVNGAAICEKVFRYSPDPDASLEAMNSIRKALMRKYGLSLQQMRSLQHVNDAHWDTEGRRGALIKRVRKFKLTKKGRK